MKIILPLLIFSMAFVSCKDRDTEMQPEEQNAYLITDSSWGKINTGTTYNDLVMAYGESSLTNERICGPECVDSLDVTIINKGKPDETIVYWHINKYHQEIASLQSSNEHAPYHTPEGLKIGSTLAEILRINKQHINFAGFGWDYGGYIHTYNGGRLENSPVQFRLEMDIDGSNALLGDTEIHSDMPEVRARLDRIKIAQIYLVFDN